MIDYEERAEREKLEANCLDLERCAGITIAMSRAREGRFIPLGIDGEKCSPEAYFADEQDHFREGARDTYFGVKGLELRKRLIQAQRKFDLHISQSFDNDIQRLRGELVAVQAKANRQPYIMAAIVAASAAIIGNWAYANVGAIVGAVGGFFLAQGVISDAKANALAAISQATEALSYVESSKADRLLWPETFSLGEELSGDREIQLDQQSAYANVIKHESLCRVGHL